MNNPEKGWPEASFSLYPSYYLLYGKGIPEQLAPDISSPHSPPKEAFRGSRINFKNKRHFFKKNQVDGQPTPKQLKQ